MATKKKNDTYNPYDDLRKGYETGLISEKEYNSLSKRLADEGYTDPYAGQSAPTPTQPLKQPDELLFRSDNQKSSKTPTAPAAVTQPTAPAAYSTDLLTQELIDALKGSMTNVPTVEDMFKQIQELMPQAPSIPTLSYGEAQKRARQKLSPLFDDSIKNLARTMDINNIRSGFYGQLPGQEIKANALMGAENQRAAAIADLAQSLVGQSEATALQREQMARQDSQNWLSAIMNMMSQSASQQQGNISNLLQAIGVLGDQSYRSGQLGLDWYKTMTGNELDWYKAKSSNELDWYKTIASQDLEWYKALSSSAIEELKYSLESERFSFTKEIENRKLDLQEAQQKIDKAYNEGRLSLEQKNIAVNLAKTLLDKDALDREFDLKERQQDWIESPDNPDNVTSYDKKLKPYIDEINAMEAVQVIDTTQGQDGYDPKTWSPIYKSKYTKEDIKAYIQNLYDIGVITEPEAEYLLALKGFKKVKK